MKLEVPEGKNYNSILADTVLQVKKILTFCLFYDCNSICSDFQNFSIICLNYRFNNRFDRVIPSCSCTLLYQRFKFKIFYINIKSLKNQPIFQN